MWRGEKAVDACSAQAAKGGKSPLPRRSWVSSAECVLGVPMPLPGFLGSVVGQDHKPEINIPCVRAPGTPPAQSRGSSYWLLGLCLSLKRQRVSKQH